MFKSPEQAVSYFESLIHYNRYCGEYVVAIHVYAHTVSEIFKGFF
jgi:hypothetical protein